VLVVAPRDLEFGWLEDSDWTAVEKTLFANLNTAGKRSIEAEEWQTFLSKVAAENVTAKDRILSVTSNGAIGLRLALLIYSKCPSEVLYVGPNGVYGPGILRGVLVGVISGVFLKTLQTGENLLLRLLRIVFGDKLQTLYAIFVEYPSSLIWVRSLISRSLAERPSEQQPSQRKRKVIHFNNALAPGGSERQFVNTVIGLEGLQELEVTTAFLRLFDFEKSDFYLPQIENASINIIAMQNFSVQDLLADTDSDFLHYISSNLPDKIRQQLLFFIGVIRQQKPDVVHLWQDETSLLGGLAAVAEGVPRIIMSSRNLAPHHFPYYRHYWKKMYRALAAHPSVRLINNSQAGANDYVRWLDISPDKFQVLRNGFLNLSGTGEQHNVDRSQAKIGPESRRQFTVGSIFRFWPEKDPMLWLHVAKVVVEEWRRSDISFSIAGDGPMRGKMLRFIEKNKLSEFVSLTGLTESSQDVLRGLDLFLLTSKVEGTPNVIIEAQAVGVPVVTTAAGGAEETVNDGVTGWVVRHRTPHAIAKTVIDVLDDENKLQKAGSEAPQFVLNRFGMERMISETIALYNF
jgi:glycosyltransferase involved in cell wall biosynthesis